MREQQEYAITAKALMHMLIFEVYINLCDLVHVQNSEFGRSEH